MLSDQALNADSIKRGREAEIKAASAGENGQYVERAGH
jgi:hypothetical protein